MLKLRQFSDGRESALRAHIMALSPAPASAPELLNAIDDYRAANNVGMMVFQQPKIRASRKVLESLASPPKTLVELGGYVGQSAVAWGDMLRSLNATSASSVKPRVFSLELANPFVTIIEDFVRLTNLSDIVQVVQGTSSDSLRSLKSKHGVDTIDVLFLDHWEEFYVPDLRICEELKLLKKGSVVIADNVDKPGAPAYLAYMKTGGENGWKYRCESVEVEHEPGAPVSSSAVIS